MMADACPSVDALAELVDGTLDWTTDAAILALRELALDEPLALPEIEERFWTLKGEIPRPGHPWYATTLAWSYLRLPGCPADRAQAFEQLIQQIYGESGKDGAENDSKEDGENEDGEAGEDDSREGGDFDERS